MSIQKDRRAETPKRDVRLRMFCEAMFFSDSRPEAVKPRPGAKIHPKVVEIPDPENDCLKR
jgi:hypothetical protein